MAAAVEIERSQDEEFWLQGVPMAPCRLTPIATASPEVGVGGAISQGGPGDGVAVGAESLITAGLVVYGSLQVGDHHLMVPASTFAIASGKGLSRTLSISTRMRVSMVSVGSLRTSPTTVAGLLRAEMPLVAALTRT